MVERDPPLCYVVTYCAVSVMKIATPLLQCGCSGISVLVLGGGCHCTRWGGCTVFGLTSCTECDVCLGPHCVLSVTCVWAYNVY